jgi:hypothetical protein
LVSWLFVVEWGQTRFAPISVHRLEFIIHLSLFTLHNSLCPCEYSPPTANTKVQTMANPKHLKILKAGVMPASKLGGRVRSFGVQQLAAAFREASLIAVPTRLSPGDAKD